MSAKDGWRLGRDGNYWKTTLSGLVGFNPKAAARLRMSWAAPSGPPSTATLVEKRETNETVRVRLEDGTVLWERS